MPRAGIQTWLRPRYDGAALVFVLAALEDVFAFDVFAFDVLAVVLALPVGSDFALGAGTSTRADAAIDAAAINPVESTIREDRVRAESVPAWSMIGAGRRTGVDATIDAGPSFAMAAPADPFGNMESASRRAATGRRRWGSEGMLADASRVPACTVARSSHRPWEGRAVPSTGPDHGHGTALPPSHPNHTGPRSDPIRSIQPPVPAATVKPSLRAARNSGAHGP